MALVAKKHADEATWYKLNEIVDANYRCDNCDIKLNTAHEDRYHCDACGDYDLCEECARARPRVHGHKLTRHKAQKLGQLLYHMIDAKTGNVVFLSNYPVALPGSPFLQACNIKSVLSLMDFDDDDPNPADAEMQVLYTNPSSGHLEDRVLIDGRVYELYNVPDISDPDLLGGHGKVDVLEHCTAFLDAALRCGNVLVHCRQGQRRSPTVLMAWMGTRGVSPEKAIADIDANYQDLRGYDNYVRKYNSWGQGYNKTRSKWVSKLVRWFTDWKELQLKWRKEHRECTEGWERMIKDQAAGVADTFAHEQAGAKRKRKQSQRSISDFAGCRRRGDKGEEYDEDGSQSCNSYYSDSDDAAWDEEDFDARSRRRTPAPSKSPKYVQRTLAPLPDSSEESEEDPQVARLKDELARDEAEYAALCGEVDGDPGAGANEEEKLQRELAALEAELAVAMFE